MNDILPKDSVTEVSRETLTERLLRQLLSGDVARTAALATIFVGLILSFIVTICIERLSGNAFQLFSTIISAALGYFFGAKSSD